MLKGMKNITLTDKISVPTQRKMTDAGQMIVPCAIARTGVQLYSGALLGLVDQADEMIEVHRTEDVVFDEASMDSFRSAPVTIGHPKDEDGKNIGVTADNADKLQVGMLEGMPVRDEDMLTGTLVITNQEAIDAIEAGTVELSAGYTCDIKMIDGEYHQTNIKANHIAIVDSGRAGSNVAIADEGEGTDEVTDEATGDVTKATIKDVDPEAMKAMKDVDTVDMTEAEAAEAVAISEEATTAEDKDYAIYLKEAADNAEAWATAHEEVSKAARKIANKKAKSISDEAEKGGDTISSDMNLVSDVNSILVALDVADENVVRLEGELKNMKDSIDAEVSARSDMIVVAKDMTDLDDFTGKTVQEIKFMVVDDLLDMDLSEKSEAYIEARFEILCEDSASQSPMGKLLSNNITSDVAPVAYVNPVAVARDKMIARNLNK